MKFSELIDSCVECIKSFNPIVKTLDSHADDFLKDVRPSPLTMKYTDPYEKVFVKQVFYGCVRYQEFLKVSLLTSNHPTGLQQHSIQEIFIINEQERQRVVLDLRLLDLLPA